MMGMNQIIKEVTRYADAKSLVHTNPLIQEFDEMMKINNGMIFSKMEYDENELNAESGNEVVDAIKKENDDFKVYKGKGFIPRVCLRTKGKYFDERELFKLRDDKNGFTFQFSLMKHEEARHIYVVFLEKDTHLQGNFYEAKRFIQGPLSRIFFDTLGFDSLMGRAVWSSNSEVRNSRKRETDWRDSKRVALYGGTRKRHFPLTGLQKFYLLCGFVFLNQIIGNDPSTRDQMVLLNPIKHAEERKKLNSQFSFNINKISTPSLNEMPLIS